MYGGATGGGEVRSSQITYREEEEASRLRAEMHSVEAGQKTEITTERGGGGRGTRRKTQFGGHDCS